MTHPTDQRAALEPCPFCGGNATVKVSIALQVCCTKCLGGTGFYSPNLRNQAIAAWNRRTPQ